MEKVSTDKKIDVFELLKDPVFLECSGNGWISFLDLMKKKGYSMRAIGEEIAEPILLAMIALESDHFTGGKIEWIKDQKDQETKKILSEKFKFPINGGFLIDGILKNEGLKNEKIIQLKGAKNPESYLTPHDVSGIIALMKGGWLIGNDLEKLEVPEGVIYITASSKGTGMLENIATPNFNIFYLEDFDWFFRDSRWIYRISNYLKNKNLNENKKEQKKVIINGFDSSHIELHKKKSYDHFINQKNKRGQVLSATSTQKSQMIWDNTIMFWKNPQDEPGIIPNLFSHYLSNQSQLYAVSKDYPSRALKDSVNIKIAHYPGITGIKNLVPLRSKKELAEFYCSAIENPEVLHVLFTHYFNSETINESLYLDLPSGKIRIEFGARHLDEEQSAVSPLFRKCTEHNTRQAGYTASTTKTSKSHKKVGLTGNDDYKTYGEPYFQFTEKEAVDRGVKCVGKYHFFTPDSLKEIENPLREFLNRINDKLVLYDGNEELMTLKILRSVALCLYPSLIDGLKYYMVTGNRISSTKQIYSIFKAVVESGIYPEMNGMVIEFLDQRDSTKKTLEKISSIANSPTGGILFHCYKAGVGTSIEELQGKVTIDPISSIRRMVQEDGRDKRLHDTLKPERVAHSYFDCTNYGEPGEDPFLDNGFQTHFKTLSSLFSSGIIPSEIISKTEINLDKMKKRKNGSTYYEVSGQIIIHAREEFEQFSLEKYVSEIRMMSHTFERKFSSSETFIIKIVDSVVKDPDIIKISDCIIYKGKNKKIIDKEISNFFDFRKESPDKIFVKSKEIFSEKFSEIGIRLIIPQSTKDEFKNYNFFNSSHHA